MDLKKEMGYVISKSPIPKAFKEGKYLSVSRHCPIITLVHIIIIKTYSNFKTLENTPVQLLWRKTPLVS